MRNRAVDTTILVHLYGASGSRERGIAEELVSMRPVISGQVISEFLNVSRRLLSLPKVEVLARYRAVFAQCAIVPLTSASLTAGGAPSGPLRLPAFRLARGGGGAGG